MEMASRYGEDPGEYEQLERVSFRIAPSHLYSYGATPG
jgi:hypothetical protein